MDYALNTQLKAFCEQASPEYDPAKLLELTKRISELLEQREEKKEPPKAHRSPGIV
jgi:hypothetical protein